MLAFDLPDSVMTQDEKRDIFEMMEDKGIRLRTLPEEVAQFIRAEDQQQL